MKIIVALMLSYFGASMAYAGSTNAYFDCVSGSGRTVLKASVPGDHLEHAVNLTIDGEGLQWFEHYVFDGEQDGWQSNSNIAVLGSMKDKNYHFVVFAPGDHAGDSREVFRFSAIPKTIKVEKTYGGERGTLKAMIHGLDPREEKKGENSPYIQVSCDYAYEI